MPIIASDYRPNRIWLRNPHVSSIYPAILRKVSEVNFTREVLEIDDGDFLDLDWYRPHVQQAKRLVIVLHGLEGSADRPYVKGMCRHFAAHGWDTLALNQRTCGGQMNRLTRAYHMGTTDDLGRTIQHVQTLGYAKIGLVGFSMGGNHVLKYLGETGDGVPASILGGVAFSVPCHIESANVEIDRPRNRIYLKRFLDGLNNKIRQKHLQFPDSDIFRPTVKMPRTFAEFDGQYTAPIHGFDGAVDYWTRNSSRQFIPGIKRPTLLVNARNDSFLSQQCFPLEEAEEIAHFFLEMPKYGGHVGFGGGRVYWSEERALRFLQEL